MSNKIDHLPRTPRDLSISQEFVLNVSMGLFPGYSVVDKFGENPEIDTTTTPEDIWEGGGLYSYDADDTAPIVSLISSDAGDTEPIQVIGLDIDGNEVEQTITLTGTTRVALTTALWRVYRMINVGTSDLAGTVYCYTGTGGGVPALSVTRAIINNGNNQTLMAVYTIPRGKVGFLFRGELGVSRSITAGEARCAYYSRRYGKVFTIKKRVNLSNSGTSIYPDSRKFPDPIPALTDIRLTAEVVSANGMGLFGTLDILLVDEDLFTDRFLTSIGQPS
jgi:hypothetical protein